MLIFNCKGVTHLQSRSSLNGGNPLLIAHHCPNLSQPEWPPPNGAKTRRNPEPPLPFMPQPGKDETGNTRPKHLEVPPFQADAAESVVEDYDATYHRDRQTGQQ